jgi:hypothetical protein
LEGSAVVETFRTTITPVLTIRQAAQAVIFYQRAFGAEEIYRNTYPDGRIVAELAIDGARFRVADETPEASNLSPQALNGTTVRINLLVADPDQCCEQRSRTAPWRSRRSRTSRMGCARGGWLIPWPPLADRTAVGRRERRLGSDA